MKHPNQEDCQVMIDIMNRDIIYSGSCSEEFRNLAKEMEKKPENWSELHEKCFGINSPWDYKYKRKKRGPDERVLVWNKVKYQQLKAKNEKVDNIN